MAITNATILMRGGKEADFDPDKMMPREFAVSTDMGIVRICIAPGICIRLATYDAFETDMAKIEAILSEVKTIEEAVIRINTEVSANADAVVEYTAQAKTYRDEAEQFRNEAFATTPEGYADLVQNVAENTAKIDTVIEKAELNIKNTASGENIHVTDSADSKVVEFALYGKAEQKQYSGKNLLKYPYQETSKTVGGITFTDLGDGRIKAVGTSTERVNFQIHGRNTGETNDFSLPNGNYIFSGCPVGGSATTYRVNFGITQNGAYKELGSDRGSGYEFTASGDDFSADSVNLGIAIDILAGQTVDLIFEPMIRLASVTDDTYEPYVGGIASPNPDYPQEINVAGESGSIGVKSVGKNRVNIDVERGYPSNTSKVNTTPRLFDDNTVILGFAVNNYYAPDFVDVNSYQKTDTGFSIAMSGGYGVGYPLKNIKPLTEYTLSFDATPSIAYNLVGIAYYDADGNFINMSRIASGGTHIEHVFSIPENVARCVLGISGNNNELTTYTISNLQFEKGTIATPYEPYKETTATISTPDGLAGIPVDSDGNYTDADGQQWISDEIIKYADGSGQRIQRVDVKVLDGVTHKASYYAAITGDYGDSLVQINLSIDNVKVFDELRTPYVLCNKARANTSRVPNAIFLYRNSDIRSIPVLLLEDTGEITSLSTANTWLASNTITLYYPLAEPIITDLTAEEIAEIEKLHTFYPVTNISNDADCGMHVMYLCDAKNYIDNRLASIEFAMINNI